MLLALSAPLLTRCRVLQDPIRQNDLGVDVDGMPLAPGDGHLLGTDSLGRDMLSRTIYGARVSLTVGIGAMLTATGIGLVFGLLAGFYGGRIDFGLMRFTDINMTLSPILLAVAFAGLMTEPRVVHLHPASLPWHALDFTLERGIGGLLVIIGLVCWPGMVRVIRAQVLAVKEQEYVQAARVLGATDAGILFRHILPNILPSVVVIAAMTTANTILLEGGLGYLGVGVPAPAPTWGSMITEGQPYFTLTPHIVAVPGLAIVLSVLAFNLIGQGLQEVFDPKLRRAG